MPPRHARARAKERTGYGLKFQLAIHGRAPLWDVRFTQRLFGKLVGDKGYISKVLFERLFQPAILLIAKIRKSMRNALLPRVDRRLLRKRSIIETENDMRKNVSHIDHTRHRSPRNFLSNLSAGPIAYNVYPEKPSLNLDIIDCKNLALFQ